MKRDNTVIIYVANTWIRVPVTHYTHLLGGAIDLRKYLGSNLAEWDFDPRRGKWQLRYRYNAFDFKQKSQVLPRYYLESIKNFIKDTDPDVVIREIPVDPVRPIRMELSLRPEYSPRNDQQRQLIEFMTDKDEYYKPVSAQTGIGKTFCAEAAICKLGYNAIIVLNSLVDQWYESILKQTTATPDDLYIVQGYPSLEKLWKMYREKRYRPKIILCASKTLQNYAANPEGPYASLPTWNEFLISFGIGTKVVDECHLAFNTTVHIDLQTNVKHSIYLSATYSRTDGKSKRIFDTVFPEDMRYGNQFVEKYTQAFMIEYRCVPVHNEWAFKVSKGYSHAKYESYLLNCKQYQNDFYLHVLKRAVDNYYINMRTDGQRLLILCWTRDYAVDIANRLAQTYTDCTVATYFSGEKCDGDPLQADIIVSTAKSAGTGLDIKNLRTAINTISFSSPVLTAQALGRLRKIPDVVTIYVDVFNSNCNSHYRHANERSSVYYKSALSLTKLEYF